MTHPPLKDGKGSKVELSLPFPPSANRLWRAVNGRNIKSEEYRKWLVAAEASIYEPRRQAIAGPYEMLMVVQRPDARRRDLSNLIKPVEDLLQQAGVIVDDCNAKRLVVQWADSLPVRGATPLVGIEITPWGGA